jgi:hypothetical protein
MIAIDSLIMVCFIFFYLWVFYSHLFCLLACIYLVLPCMVCSYFLYFRNSLVLQLATFSVICVVLFNLLLDC